MIIPKGHHALCPDCTGTGGVLRGRAGAVAGGRIGTRVAAEQCQPCEGTGWIPPKRGPNLQTEGEQDN